MKVVLGSSTGQADRREKKDDSCQKDLLGDLPGDLLDQKETSLVKGRE